MANPIEGYEKFIGEHKRGKLKGGLLGFGMHSMHVPGFKKGGNVKKTGIYKLHKGERVIPAHKSHKTLDI